MLQIVVIYDISDDKARRKVSEACLDYGLDRYQFSVFAGRIKSIHLRELTKILRPYARTGQITLMTVAADDWGRRIQLGESLGGRDHGSDI